MENEALEGQVLAGKYRVERVLGRGGMGVVVAAHHLQLDEKVAIKFLLPEAVKNSEFVGRFMREARAAVRIKSEHVAHVADVGTLESGAPYIVMEYLDGLDLAAWVRDQGPLPFEQAVEFVLQASEAIAEAHALGIVHRDLKPANLFVVRRADGLWSVKVLDFGISKVSPLGMSASSASLTQTAAVMGSPLYMPPEQMAASKSVDARADIWALGIILYELISGVAPFAGETLPEVCMKIAIEPPRPIRERRPDIAPGLEAIILRCLEKARELRYPNVAELAQALLEFAPKRARNSVERITRTIQAAGLGQVNATPASEPSVPLRSATLYAPVGTGTEAPWGRTEGSSTRSSSRRTGLVVGAFLVLCVAGAGLGIARWFSASSHDESKVGSAVSSSAPAVPALPLEPPSALAVSPPVVSPPPLVEPVPSAQEIAPVEPEKSRPTASPAAHAASRPKLTGRNPAASVKHDSTPAAVVPPAPRPAPKANSIFDDR